jgi:hypothetical protein
MKYIGTCRINIHMAGALFSEYRHKKTAHIAVSSLRAILYDRQNIATPGTTRQL